MCISHLCKIIRSLHMYRVEISMFTWAKSLPRTWELDWAFEVHGLGWGYACTGVLYHEVHGIWKFSLYCIHDSPWLVACLLLRKNPSVNSVRLQNHPFSIKCAGPTTTEVFSLDFPA